jgi:hypothetical protein
MIPGALNQSKTSQILPWLIIRISQLDCLIQGVDDDLTEKPWHGAFRTSTAIQLQWVGEAGVSTQFFLQAVVSVVHDAVVKVRGPVVPKPQLPTVHTSKHSVTTVISSYTEMIRLWDINNMHTTTIE